MSTAPAATPSVLPGTIGVGGTSALCNPAVRNSSNGILPLDAQTSDLYGMYDFLIKKTN